MKMRFKLGSRRPVGSNNAAASRKRKLGGAVAAVLEPMESRVMLTALGIIRPMQEYTPPHAIFYAFSVSGAQGGASSALAVSGRVADTVAGVGPSNWMSAQPDSIPLTDLSMPGTYASASGPKLQDALLGSGSTDQFSPPDPTADGLTEADLALHVAAGTALETAILAGGSNQLANAASIAANSAASAADLAQGITGASDGAGLYVGLASDATTIASTVAAFDQVAKANASSTGDTAAADADAGVTTDDTAAGAAHSAAGGADATAGGADATAGTTDATAGVTDATAGTADATAGAADTAGAVADGAAAASDVIAAAQGAIDPVADGVAAGLDTAGAIADTAAGVADTAAGVSSTAAVAADATAVTADGVAVTGDATAVTADAAAGGSDGAASASNTTGSGAYATAAANHTAGAISDGISAASYVAAAASDGLTSQSYGAFAAGMSTPDSTGGNSTNAAYQSAVLGLAATGAATHAASAAAEAVAAVADSVATHLNTVASAADTAAVTALGAATAANAAAVAANSSASGLDATASGLDATAGSLDAAAGTADAAATAADAAAGGLDAAAGIADGISAGADAAAAVADTTAIALDATALATIEIPFLDIATAAAAGIADGIAIGLDVTATAADTATAVADGLATAADATATAADTTATVADTAATTADVAATTADTAATTADTTATGLDTAATDADAAAVTACKAADAANEAADASDTAANNVNHVATVASLASVTADVAFDIEGQQVMAVEIAAQTQSLGIADQLEAGVRSLDLRGALVNDNINLNAAQDFTGVTLQDALNDTTSFLQANPTETVVVTLSANEAAAVNSPSGFNADLNTLLNSSDTSVPGTTYKDFVYYSSDSSVTPDLGAVRGKIVIIPSADSSWTPAADPVSGLKLGWQPTEVDQDSPAVTDSNARWNFAENDNGDNASGLIPTDLGNPTRLYRNNLSQDNTSAATPVTLGDQVNAIAEQYFGAVKVSRTTGIVGMDDAGGLMDGDATVTLSDQSVVDETLINEIIAENNAPIIVTSDSDAPGDTGTLRAAITQANSQPGFNTIEFANNLTGTTGNGIILQSDLPVVTNDLDVAGSVFINTNSHQGFQAAASHQVTETNYVASDSGPVTIVPATDSHPVYLVTSGVTIGALPPVEVNPVNLSFGIALVNSQLHGVATYISGGSPVIVPGTFTYTSAVGSVLLVGNGQSEAVTFTPNDTTTFAPVSGTVIVNITKGTPTGTSVNPVNITYGTALASGQLHGTASAIVNGNSVTLPGAFIYANAGSVLHGGNGQSESVTFVPTDTADFASVLSTVTVNVAKAAPTVTSVNPVNIAPGTALNNNQLSGAATFTVNGNSVTVFGAFTYTSAGGTVLPAGNGQNEGVTFTPTDTADYTTAQSSVVVNVEKPVPAAPNITANPVNITYGTELANSQLSGVAVDANFAIVAGTFIYTSVAGNVLNAGDGQSEAVTFNPTDSTSYLPASGTVTVNVASAPPTIARVNPVSITYGTALASGQLSGSATFVVAGNNMSVPGTFSYTSATGAVLNAGNSQSEAVTFTPSDNIDFTTASSTVTVNVAKATPIVTTVNLVNIDNATPLANSQLSGVADFTVAQNLVPVVGVFTYNSGIGTLLKAGNGQTEAVTFTPNDTTDYTTVSATVILNVAKVTPTVTVTDAGGVYNGFPFPATGTVTGLGGVDLGTPTFTYYLLSDTKFANPLAGAPSTGGSYVAVASVAETAEYGVGAAKTTFVITPATPTVTNVNPVNIIYGTALANSQLSGSASFTIASNPVSVPGTFTYTAALGNILNAVNGQTEAVTFHPTDAADFTTASSTVTVNVAKAATATAIASSANPGVYGQQITYTATVSNSSGTGAVPVGTVQFIVDGVNSGSPVSLNAAGQAVTLPIIFLTGSSHTIAAVYSPSPNFTASSSTSLKQVMQFIAIEGSVLFIGSDGATSDEQVLVNPTGKSNTGSTGVQVQTQLNRIITSINYSQVFSAVQISLQNGNDTVAFGLNLMLNAVVSAGNGNDTVHFPTNGNDSVTLGNGRDVVQLGSGANNVTLGNGNDLVQTLQGTGANTVVLGSGNDTLDLANGNNAVTVGRPGASSNDVIVLGSGNNTVTLLNPTGNDQVSAGAGNNTVNGAASNGNDSITLGNGNNLAVLGNGNDTLTAGNGNNLLVGGLGLHTLIAGTGRNILIDGSVITTQPGDSLQAVLNSWITGGASSANIASIRSRIKVTYNTTKNNTLRAGSGMDWFWYTDTKDLVNIKPTDLRN